MNLIRPSILFRLRLSSEHVPVKSGPPAPPKWADENIDRNPPTQGTACQSIRFRFAMPSRIGILGVCRRVGRFYQGLGTRLQAVREELLVMRLAANIFLKRLVVNDSPHRWHRIACPQF
jgi:hypothetical protein